MASTAGQGRPAQPVRWAGRLRPGQRAELHVVDVDTGLARKVLSSTQRLVVAPHWHPSGRWIVVNADGLLFRIEADAASRLVEIPTPGLPELNNDQPCTQRSKTPAVARNSAKNTICPWGVARAQNINLRLAMAPDRLPARNFHNSKVSRRTLFASDGLYLSESP